jgi:hypothetical protein
MCDYITDPETGEDSLGCDRTDNDWVIGWEQGRKLGWFCVRENGSELTEHATHNDAMRHAQATDTTVMMFHEADGGGCLGSFEESPYNDNDEC